MTVQRVLKTHWDSRKLDWTRLDRCEHPLTLESDWTGLDSTRLCWCVRSLSGGRSQITTCIRENRMKQIGNEAKMRKTLYESLGIVMHTTTRLGQFGQCPKGAIEEHY